MEACLQQLGEALRLFSERICLFCHKGASIEIPSTHSKQLRICFRSSTKKLPLHAYKCIQPRGALDDLSIDYERIRHYSQITLFLIIQEGDSNIGVPRDSMHIPIRTVSESFHRLLEVSVVNIS
jgi:hypothetical protein